MQQRPLQYHATPYSRGRRYQVACRKYRQYQLKSWPSKMARICLSCCSLRLAGTNGSRLQHNEMTSVAGDQLYLCPLRNNEIHHSNYSGSS